MSAITGLSSAAQSPTSAYETMTSDDFIRVMFAELTRQDPTKPTDSKDLLDQLGSIRSIESDVSLTKRLQDIAKQNEITSAGSLVGKFVRGKSASGDAVRGFVDSVSVTREGLVLNLSSQKTLPMSGLEEVYDPALVATAPTGGTGASQARPAAAGAAQNEAQDESRPETLATEPAGAAR